MLEMVGAQSVAIDALAIRFGVAGMEIEPVAAGNERNGFLEIAAQLLRGPGLARVVAGGHQPAPECLPGVFKTAHIVPLPAMNGDRDAAELSEGIVGPNTQLRVAFLCQRVCRLDS